MRDHSPEFTLAFRIILAAGALSWLFLFWAVKAVLEAFR